MSKIPAELKEALIILWSCVYVVSLTASIIIYNTEGKHNRNLVCTLNGETEYVGTRGLAHISYPARMTICILTHKLEK